MSQYVLLHTSGPVFSNIYLLIQNIINLTNNIFTLVTRCNALVTRCNTFSKKIRDLSLIFVYTMIPGVLITTSESERAIAVAEVIAGRDRFQFTR